jgi:hypothetical protein
MTVHTPLATEFFAHCSVCPHRLAHLCWRFGLRGSCSGPILRDTGYLRSSGPDLCFCRSRGAFERQADRPIGGIRAHRAEPEALQAKAVR